MPGGSLLTPEVLALVGRTGRTVPVRVTRRVVEKTYDLYPVPGGTPLPSDAGAAVTGTAMTILESEGEKTFMAPQLLPNRLVISEEWEFERPLRLGEDLVVTSCIADVSERLGGRFGHSIQFRSETTLATPEGEIVARASHTLMQYDVRNERGTDE